MTFVMFEFTTYLSSVQPQAGDTEKLSAAFSYASMVLGKFG